MEEVENEDDSSGEDSDIDNDDKESRFKAIKMDFDGIDQKVEKVEQGWDGIIISTFDGFFTVYRLLPGGYSSSPGELMCRENQGFVIPLKNWKFPSAVISFSIMGIECSGNAGTRRSSLSNFGGNLTGDSPGVFTFASSTTNQETKFRQFPLSTFSPTPLPRTKTLAQIFSIPEEEEGENNSPKGRPTIDLKNELTVVAQSKFNRRKLSSFDKGERDNSFHNRVSQFFNQTFILVTFISGTSLPFYFSQSQAEIQVLIQEAKKQGDMVNNAQLLRVYPLKSFYKRSHQAQVLFLNEDSRYSIYQLNCFSSEIVNESQIKKKIGDAVFTKKVVQDTNGWGVVQAQMAQVPIGEHNGPIKKRERCLIVGLINKEIWFIFKEKERWKLKVEFPIISFYFGDIKVNAGDSKRVATLMVFNYTQEAQVFYDIRVPKEESA